MISTESLSSYFVPCTLYLVLCTFYSEMELFFTKNIHVNIATLDPEESRHAVKVLRLKKGEIIHVTDGSGSIHTCEVAAAEPSALTAVIKETITPNKRPYTIHIAIAPTKNIDRFEWFLEKATEFGIDEITPVICKHSERTVIKPERLEKILVSAMKQSNQSYLPKLNSLRPLSELLKQNIDADKFIAHCSEDDQKHLLVNQLKSDSSVMVLIGPEGDFSKDEISLSLEKNFKPASLGSTRLRTETAGLAAVTTVHIVNQMGK